MKTIYFILVFTLFAAGGCKDNDKETLKYREPFIGKWKEIACGNDMFPELEPNGHVIDFLPDGTYHSTGRWGDQPYSYWVDADFLYLNSGKKPDGYTYRYTFTDADTLRLDLTVGLIHYSTGTPTFNIYERLK